MHCFYSLAKREMLLAASESLVGTQHKKLQVTADDFQRIKARNDQLVKVQCLVLVCTMQFNAIQYNEMQCNAIQYNTHNTVECNEMQQIICCGSNFQTSLIFVYIKLNLIS